MNKWTRPGLCPLYRIILYRIPSCQDGIPRVRESPVSDWESHTGSLRQTGNRSGNHHPQERPPQLVKAALWEDVTHNFQEILEECSVSHCETEHSLSSSQPGERRSIHSMNHTVTYSAILFVLKYHCSCIISWWWRKAYCWTVLLLLLLLFFGTTLTAFVKHFEKPLPV